MNPATMPKPSNQPLIERFPTMTESTPPQLLMRRPDLAGAPLVTNLPDGYELREATVEDNPALAELLTAAFSELDAWTPQIVADRLTAAPDVDAVYVVTHQ